MKIVVAAMLVAAMPLLAQQAPNSLPDSPSYSAALVRPQGLPAIVASTPQRIRPSVTLETRSPNKRAFTLLSAVAVASTVADLEFTAHCLASNPRCREANPLYGSHPSRARMYAIAMPMTAAQIWFSNHLRKKHPERKLWMIPTLTVTAVHSVGAASGSF